MPAVELVHVEVAEADQVAAHAVAQVAVLHRVPSVVVHTLVAVVRRSAHAVKSNSNKHQ